MRKIVLGLLVLVLLVSGGYAALSRNGVAAVAQVTPTATPQDVVKAGNTVSVEAVVVPRASVELRFPASDIVSAVLVNEGDTVSEGTPLARLDTRGLELRVAQAQVTLQKAQAAYDKLKLGATPDEIAAAQAQVAQVQGQLRQARGSVTANDIAAARAQLASARAALARLEAGPKTAEVKAARVVLEQARTALAELEAGPKATDVQAAQAGLDQARATLAQAEAGPKTADVQAAQAGLDQARANYQTQAANLSVAKTRAQAQLEQAADSVRQAQEAYSAAWWDNDQAQSGRNPRTGNAFEDDDLNAENAQEFYKRILRDAENRLEQAEHGLEQAQLSLEQSRQAEISGLAAAQAQIDQAQAGYDKVLTSIDASAIAAARAQVAQAESSLDQLVRIDPVQLTAARAQVAQAESSLDKLLRIEPSELAAARAQVAQAQAQLNKLQGEEQAGRVAAAAAGVESAQAGLEQLTAGVSAPDLAGALAEVEAARVAIREAELQVDQATLRAPISGTVAQINLKVGEVPVPTIAAVVLADFSVWQIETTDLNELSIVNITEGAPVTITIDALPGIELAGTVSQIKPIGLNKQGDITYTAVITPDQQDARLRWNMTAAVLIETR